MGTKVSKCLTIDSELFTRVTKDTTNISKRIEQLLQYGELYEIQQKNEPTLNECIEMLIRAYKGTAGTHKEVKIEVKENPIQEIEQNDKDSKLKQFLISRYKEQYIEDEFAENLIALEELPKFIDDNMDYIKDVKGKKLTGDTAYSRMVNKLKSMI